MIRMLMIGSSVSYQLTPTVCASVTSGHKISDTDVAEGREGVGRDVSTSIASDRIGGTSDVSHDRQQHHIN